MTRKQAIQRAIEVLSANAENDEAIALLQDISNELPLVHWSDKSIRDSVEQFRLDHGRVPTVTDFKKAKLPPHPVVKKTYDITLAEWLTENYPEEHPSKEQLIKQRIHNFIEDYNRIKPDSPRQYNEHRAPKATRWQTIGSYLNVSTWKELVERLELQPYLPPPKERQPMNMDVRIYLDFEL